MKPADQKNAPPDDELIAQRVQQAAQRARAEAEARRAEACKKEAGAPVPTPREVNGRGGLDPVRYQDWEIKGLTSDF